MAGIKENYVDALFELYLESGMRAEYRHQAVLVRDALDDPESRDLLQHPHVPSEQKRAFLKELFAGRISGELLGFLLLAAEAGQGADIVPLLSEFIDRIDRYRGKLKAAVFSAVPLSAGQLETLRVLLTRKLNQPVELETQVEPSLIGGFYIHVGGHLIDCTVKTQLQKMKEQLKKGDTE